MLDPGDNLQNPHKTGVIDTLVAEVQGIPGEDRCIILVGYEDKMKDMFHRVNPGLSRRFPIETPFRFENFSLSQLEELLRLKLSEQDLHATEEAIKVAHEILARALMRPKFSNGGDVESCLAKAKLNYEARQSKTSASERSFDIVLEDEDFDSNFDRAVQEESKFRELLHGTIDECIIAKLERYQKQSRIAIKCGLNPRELLPTNFIFKGPPGNQNVSNNINSESANEFVRNGQNYSCPEHGQTFLPDGIPLHRRMHRAVCH